MSFRPRLLRQIRLHTSEASATVPFCSPRPPQWEPDAVVRWDAGTGTWVLTPTETGRRKGWRTNAT